MAILALSACATPKPLVGSPAIQVVDVAGLPPPIGTSADGVMPYLIGPADKLTVTVANMPELTQKEIRVDAGGHISVPLAGVIEAGGHTPAEVERAIETRLRAAYVRAPQVSINLIESNGQLVTVDGEVTEPGLYPVIGPMSLMRAVADAKGTKKFAKLDDVVVFRTVGGQKMAALYNLGAIRRGAYDDPKIYANDIVVVGESRARRLFDGFLQLAPLLTTPLILILQKSGK